MNEITKNVLNFKDSLQAIQKQFGDKTPDCTLVLGSGLKDVINAFQIEKTLPILTFLIFQEAMFKDTPVNFIWAKFMTKLF
jgi:hypothetical protein